MAEVSLSTMWGIGRLATFREFVEKAQEFGCPAIELNHGFPQEWLDELEAGTLAGLPLRVSSVHDPCPNRLMAGGRYPSSYQLAALDEDERRMAVSIAQGSIDLAARYGGSAVVLHLGSTGSFNAEEAHLRKLYTQEGPASPDFLNLRADLVQRRSVLVEAALGKARQTLQELIPYAAERSVRLGLENRQDYMELPGIDEMGLLLAEAGPNVVGFWYDVGHAMLLDRLGLTPHEAWLTRYSSRMIGTHLHEVIGVTDHRAPGVPGGTVPWDVVSRFIPADALRVMEINQTTDDDLVRQAIPFLQAQGVLA